MAKSGTVIGWKLDRDQRGALLGRFPPRYEGVIADHVTLKSDAESDPLPCPVDAQIVGRADDGDSLEAMVVTIDGTVDRPDGSTYHITWSLGAGRRARESNEVLRDQGWERLDEPVPSRSAGALLTMSHLFLDATACSPISMPGQGHCSACRPATSRKNMASANSGGGSPAPRISTRPCR